ncbi:DUF6177 family protein [Kribbella shirazensis]|uniref:Uncharacterized protein n=1 Tax=Kribbella shirazensis TaxID=1105143 RepID=A0A7X5VDT8_9ACTN|nr:DUF6177 family protein [Kribbella shirazensis]NIK59400.1 hypothetical protein [Kribbella shirazensis]
MPNALIFSPGVDLITEKVAVVMQDRPVVGMSAWLSDAVASAKAAGRAVQLVTPRSSRITWPVRSALFRTAFARWVVSGDDGEYFDGLNGVRLQWNGDLFVARAATGRGKPHLHPDFLVRVQPFGQFQLTVRVRHKPVASLVLGRVAERLFTAASGAAPAGWSTSEPVTQPWSPDALTEYCRRRAPQPTWLVLAGQPGGEFRPSIGTLETRRTRSGLDETVTLAVAQPGLELPEPHRIGEWIDEIADNFELVSATVLGSYGAADGSYEPRFLGIACPIGVAAGNEAVRASSLAELLKVEGVSRALAIGPAHRPAVWYPIGDGRTPGDWQRYAKLMNKLVPGPERGRA